MLYDQYEPGEVYIHNLLSSDYIGKDIKCLYKTKTIKSGRMIEAEIFPSFLNRKDYMRAKKIRGSTKEQIALNEKNARKKIIRLVNANFWTDDLWGTFGWDDGRQPISEKDAKRQVVNFINRIKYYCSKHNLGQFRYIYVIETTECRDEKGEPFTKYHVHIVMSGNVDRDKVEKLWNGGEYPQTRRLVIKDFGGLTGLATYISKCPYGQKRWGQSIGLKAYSQRPSSSYHKFKKSRVEKMVADQNTIKDIFEREYPGYQYSEDYPCEIKYNEIIGGYYLYCRMYLKPSLQSTARKGRT